MNFNQTLTLTNYKKEEILMDADSLGQFILLNSYDLSLTQDFCRRALKTPICVFAKGDQELYFIIIGKPSATFCLIVSSNEKNAKKVKEIKFFPTIYEAQNIAKGWALVHFKEG